MSAEFTNGDADMVGSGIHDCGEELPNLFRKTDFVGIVKRAIDVKLQVGHSSSLLE